MLEIKRNDSCIIGLPSCGYGFNSSRMAFIAAPNDKDIGLEINILQDLLEEKNYESYLAVQETEPAKFAFCKKICSKIITSQFCIVLLNTSEHKKNKSLRIPNPNVYFEYGLMMGFKKYIIPLQIDSEERPFNVDPLDTVLYAKNNFKKKAEEAIDQAILAVGDTAGIKMGLPPKGYLLNYFSIRNLHISQLDNPDLKALYKMGGTLGFWLLEGPEFVYLGQFDQEPAKEVIFRLKLLLQNFNFTLKRVEKELSGESFNSVMKIWDRIRVEVIISEKQNRTKIEGKVKELTNEMKTVPWKILYEKDILKQIDDEYKKIGEV